jgi:hypothetical protein
MPCQLSSPGHSQLGQLQPINSSARNDAAQRSGTFPFGECESYTSSHDQKKQNFNTKENNKICHRPGAATSTSSSDWGLF